MSLPLPTPSNRLLRAATAEHAGLARRRERLTAKRDRLMSEVRRLDDAVAAVDERVRVLQRLTDNPAPSVAKPSIAPNTNRDESVIRGPAIREIAVQVLINQPGHVEALHYRRWHELLRHAGYAVAGKDPLAVFLTQLSRSPVVRKATEPGVYEVDRQAPLRIRQRLERLQAELREVAIAPAAPIELADVRARRHELDLAISQQERALEEALRVLRRDDAGIAPLGAASGG